MFIFSKSWKYLVKLDRIGVLHIAAVVAALDQEDKEADERVEKMRHTLPQHVHVDGRLGA